MRAGRRLMPTAEGLFRIEEHLQDDFEGLVEEDSGTDGL